MSTLARTIGRELTTVQIVIGVVISIILANIWYRAFKNFFYNTLGLNKYSAYQTLIIALATTVFFIVLLSYISSFAREIVLGGVVGNTQSHQILGAGEGAPEVDLLPRCQNCSQPTRNNQGAVLQCNCCAGGCEQRHSEVTFSSLPSKRDRRQRKKFNFSYTDDN